MGKRQFTGTDADRKRTQHYFWRGEGLSIRGANALARRGLGSWEALLHFSVQEIRGFMGVGETVMAEIQITASSRGHALKDEPRPKGTSLRRVPSGKT
jgi:hypothetical protein